MPPKPALPSPRKACFLPEGAGRRSCAEENSDSWCRLMRSTIVAFAGALLCSYVVASVEARFGQPHVKVFGHEITDAVCQARDVKAELASIIAGRTLPYAFLGPALECNNSACQHEYWMSRSRWDAKNEPACPLPARKQLIGRLCQHAVQQGGDWIYDALSLKPCDLWPLLRNRTVWVIGDSLSQDFTTSLVSFMIEYLADEGRPISNDAHFMQRLTKTSSGKDMPAWCIHLGFNTRICSLRANKAPRMEKVLLELLPEVADQEQDIVIFNFGAWYNYLDDGMGELKLDMVDFEASFRAACGRLPKRLIWRECTAQHFNTTSGMFDPQATIADQRCVPAGSRLGVKVGLDATRNLVYTGSAGNETRELNVLLQGGHRNIVVQPVIERLQIPTLPIWNISLVLSEFHNNYHRPDSHGECVYVECDCSHACSPSWYQLIFADLKAMLDRDWDSGSSGVKASRCSSSVDVDII